MKAQNWPMLIAALAIVFVMFETPYHLRGSEWAVWLAEVCIGLVGLAALFFLAKWADKKSRRDIDESRSSE